VAAGAGAAIYGTVNTDIPGTGWTDTAGTEGKKDISVESGAGLDLREYKILSWDYPISWVISTKYLNNIATDGVRCSFSRVWSLGTGSCLGWFSRHGVLQCHNRIRAY
jgi:hypothetical protein